MVGGKQATRRRKRSQSPNNGGRQRRRLKQLDSQSEDGGGGSCQVMLFQECAGLSRTLREQEVEVDAASVFFDLANSPLVGYRINNKDTIVIHQDNNCAIHTGGIVWETSYLLAEYLIEKFGRSERECQHPLGKTLEIGAGCGMLGLILAANGLSSRVVLTEASEVMTNLMKNVSENVTETKLPDGAVSSDVSTQLKGVHGTIFQPVCPKDRVSVIKLRWDHLKVDVAAAAVAANESNYSNVHDLQPHSFDSIIGTDVVFEPSLVRPLLKTISKMARKKSSKTTLIYLCLQIRCPDSHALLFSEAPKYRLEVTDVSEELRRSKCKWGLELECILLKINRMKCNHSTHI